MVVKFLKELAVNYTHPELGVVTTNHITFDHNYISSHSTVAQKDVYDDDERSQSLVNTVFLNSLVVDSDHPELVVVTAESITYGRNYFLESSTVVQNMWTISKRDLKF